MWLVLQSAVLPQPLFWRLKSAEESAMRVSTAKLLFNLTANMSAVLPKSSDSERLTTASSAAAHLKFPILPSACKSLSAQPQTTASVSWLIAWQHLKAGRQRTSNNNINSTCHS